MTQGDVIDLFDKRGIPFVRGDIVKVFHFVDRRRKRHYMYHQCLGTRPIGKNASPYVAFSHLNFIEDHRITDGPYLQRPDGRKLSEYEIVQSINCDHEERDRVHGEQAPQNGEPK